ncbi:tetratricopeptide repeat protein [Roseibium denhamense]|uniref:Tetratricopeptide repeat-containing protein n=1 Tax=Roseibium denhamense TaxID=76305 RepID=A0ABY1NWM0_9HYPH|nr:tetratricopeptide repeat protein [Roseibium denhamense]MTI04855.1 tetratricopeptide repeat protein [Roseibium denhamense]SMP19950.1 Tetratricopeptide repeat-containing protein [Roseibium denhamense]
MLLVDDRLKAAKDHANAGRHDNAALLFESILDISPGHPEALSGLLKARLESGDLEGAQAILSRASGQATQDPDFLSLAAKALILSNKAEEGEQLAERALALDPAHSQSVLLKAEFLATRGQLEEAELLLNGVLQRNRGDADVLQAIAKLYFAYGLFPPALAIAQDALTLLPDDARLNAFVGQILTALGDHGKATPFLEKAHLAEPNHPEYMLAIANNASALGQHSDALRVASRAKAMFPELMPIWLVYIKIMADRGNAAQALKEFAPVAKAAKDRMEATLTLGAAYRLAGEPEKAIALLEPLKPSAARLADPVRARLQSILRDAYLSTGRIDEAADTVAPVFYETLKLPEAERDNPEAIKARSSQAVLLLDPGLTNLEFMVMARFFGTIGNGRETPLAGPGSLSQLARMFGYTTYIANDAPGGASPPDGYPYSLPVSQILKLPEAVRGKPASGLPYLHSQPNYNEKWQSALSEFPRPWIGIAWNEATPGLTLDTLMPAVSGFPGTLIATNWDHSRQQLSGHAGVIDAGRHLQSMPDLAALISCLDMVIGPDTLVLHAAGASGKPGIVLNTYSEPWYWYHTGDGCLWYPTLKGITAPRAAHWAETMPELHALIQSTGSSILDTLPQPSETTQ